MISSELRSALGRRSRRLVQKVRTPRGPRVSLRRPAPVSEQFGYDRGTPIDRFYIERFLGAQADRITGRVLEIGDSRYTRQFGRAVASADVLHAVAGNPQATIVGDLADPATLGGRSFDAIVLTQTLQFVPDPGAAVASCYAALAPGGSLLATVPCISQISRYDMDRWGDFWRFTGAGASRLFGAVFGAGAVEIAEYGNAGAACAFLQGLAVEEVGERTLTARHRDYPVLIGVAARR